MSREVIGIAGNLASGKDTVGDIFADIGFLHVSSSDYLRDFIAINELGRPDRSTMTTVARSLRDERGAAYLIESCLEAYSDTERLAISGIYTPAEAQRIQEIGGRVIVVVCRDPHIRYQRLKARNAVRDDLSFEQFVAAEAEENSGGETQQNVSGIVEIADSLVYNEAGLDHLRTQINQAYQGEGALYDDLRVA